jgi:hypothetical protein
MMGIFVGYLVIGLVCGFIFWCCCAVSARCARREES